MSETKSDASHRPADRVVTGPDASTPDLQSRHVTGPVLLLDRLSRRIKRQATRAREISRIQGKRDSDYYFGIAEGLDRAATQIRGEYIRAKAMQVSPMDGETPPPAQ